MKREAILHTAYQRGFAAGYFLSAPPLEKNEQFTAATLLLLLFPYRSWGEEKAGHARISMYYYAAQTAYSEAVEMVRQLNREGEKAALLNHVRVKPLLNHLPDFTQGRNTLHYHKALGSRFHVQLIGLENHFLPEADFPACGAPRDMCGSCRKCAQACPSGAIAEDGFVRDKCLRQHMMRGTPMPENLRPLMKNRLVGCDICQQACPYNAFLQEAGKSEGCAIASLLNQDATVLAALAQGIGPNLALPNRVLAQACIVAGNSGDAAYIPILRNLLKHPSPAVAEHAQWAVSALAEQAKDAATQR